MNLAWRLRNTWCTPSLILCKTGSEDYVIIVAQKNYVPADVLTLNPPFVWNPTALRDLSIKRTFDGECPCKTLRPIVLFVFKSELTALESIYVAEASHICLELIVFTWKLKNTEELENPKYQILTATYIFSKFCPTHVFSSNKTGLHFCSMKCLQEVHFLPLRIGTLLVLQGGTVDKQASLV